MRYHDAIRQQVAELGVRPSLDDEPRDKMQVGARVDLVRNAGGDHRENGSGAFAAVVEPGEEPVLTTEDETAKLPLASVLGRVDVTVVEEEQEPVPLAVQVAECLAQWSLGRRELAVPVEPEAQVVDHRPGVGLATETTLVGSLASHAGSALDGEDGRRRTDRR